MAKVGKSQLDASSIKAIADSVLEQAQKTKDGDFSSIEVILHSQIAMLSTLSSHFMNKAIAFAVSIIVIYSSKYKGNISTHHKKFM
jgi:hypothetical protein